MNRSLLFTLGILTIALAAGGLLLVEAVNVPEQVASAAIRLGALRIAVGTLLVVGPVVRRDIPRAVGIAMWLLAGAFFADAWIAVRLEASTVQLLAGLLLTASAIVLLVHAAGNTKQG